VGKTSDVVEKGMLFDMGNRTRRRERLKVDQ
jgi:hypothetical protein